MWVITEVDDINEFDGVITSSPLLTPIKQSPKVNASVPLFKDTANLVPQIFFILFSKVTTSSGQDQHSFLIQELFR